LESCEHRPKKVIEVCEAVVWIGPSTEAHVVRRAMPEKPPYKLSFITTKKNITTKHAKNI